MRSVSERFLAALRGPHRARTIIDAFYNDGQTGDDLPFTDGTVSCDRGSNIRRQASLTFAGDLYPTKADDPLSPYGSQLRIRRALVFGDGTEEVVDLGWFRVDSCQVSDEGTVSVDASDRSAIVSDAKFLSPYSVDTTEDVVQIVADLLWEAVPGAQVHIDASRTDDRPGAATYDEDRLQAVADLVSGIGAECFADAEGNFVLRDIPDLDTTPPVWTVDTGEYGVRVGWTRQQSREAVYNAVVIRSEDTSGESGVWQYVAQDLDSDSPTRWFGPFGQVPRFHSSPSIRTIDAAAAAAEGLLRETLGISRSVDLTLVPNFALEPGDVITVVGAGRSESHLIETLSIPLTVSGSMSATTRAKTYWLASS